MGIITLFSTTVFSMESSEVSSGYTETKYPILMVQGIGGWNDPGYFNGAVEALTKDGAEVFVAKVTPHANTESKALTLVKDIEDILALTGKDKVNIIAYSIGVIHSRQAASIIPENVASVTSVGGPNNGTPIGRIIARPDGFYESLVSTFFTSAGGFFSLLNGASSLAPYDPSAAFEGLDPDIAKKFNQENPWGYEPHCDPTLKTESLASNGIHYFSWGGTGLFTNILDPSGLYTFWASTMIPEENDGIVSRCSSHLGKVIKDDYHMDHLDLINGMLGLVSSSEVSPVTLFRQHANRLQLLGL